VECDHPSGSDSLVTFESTLWGPTCDSADYLYKNVQLPELRNGDWLMFVNSGAYTVAGACDFNGIAMTQPNKYYVFSAQAVDEAEESKESTESEAESEEEEDESEEDDSDSEGEEEEATAAAE
jgi:ornithine decarboxylase